jgi:hypothetical protein
VRQCRDRWNHYLSRTPPAEEWTPEEDELLRTKAVERWWEWKQVANFFPTRSERDVQRRWAIIRRAPKKSQEGQTEEVTEEKPAAAAAAPGTTAENETVEVADSVWWSFWEGPYGFSFS